MRRLLALLGLLAALLGPAAVARADSDPASDILLGQDAFYPYQPPTATALTRSLERALTEIHATGVPLKVAIIGSQTDLGGVPNLWGMPQRYAAFLDSEISFNHPQALLVVMPAGFGVAGLGGLSAPSVPIDAHHGSNGLTHTAVLAVERLAAAHGHPIAPVSLPSASGAGGGGGTPALIIFGVPVAIALIAGGLLALRRPHEEAEGYWGEEEPPSAPGDGEVPDGAGQ